MADTGNLLVIAGANGTGTSLVLAMLNARPDIFVTYEVRPYSKELGNYSRSFLERFPTLEPIFADRSLSPIARYGCIQAELGKHGHRYCYFGDKIPTLEAAEVASLIDAPFFIFTVRDIRTWLCKEKIFRLPHVVGDAVPIMRRYLAVLFEALAAEHALILRLEDCVLHNRQVVGKLAEYLRLPDRRRLGQWWKHVIPREQDPKAACPWFGSGPIPGKAAGLRPVELDVKYELRRHPVWDILLPLFDKYYTGLEERRFSATEITSDRKRLDSALAGLQAPLADLYRSFTSWKFAQDEAGQPMRRNVWRLTQERRLYRPGRLQKAAAKEARELMRNPKRPVLLMIEAEDEPLMAVRHWNLFDSRRFRDAVEQAGVLVLRLDHRTARALLPGIASTLHPPAPVYLYRRREHAEWQVLPEDVSLDTLSTRLLSPASESIRRTGPEGKAGETAAEEPSFSRAPRGRKQNAKRQAGEKMGRCG